MVWFLLALLQSSWAADQKFVVKYDDLCEELFSLVNDGPRTLSDFKKEFKAKIKPIGDGVWHLEDRKTTAEEVRTAKLLGRWVGERNGGKVLLVTSVSQVHVPYFDGVLFDREENAVANIQLKTADSPRLYRPIYKAVRAGGLALHRKSWVRPTNYPMIKERHSIPEVEMTEAAYRRHRTMVGWEKKIIRLFNPRLGEKGSQGRGTVIFIDAVAPVARISEEEMKSIRDEMKKRKNILSVILHQNGKFQEIIPAE